MPRILRIINRFNLGGPTYNVAYLTKYLDPKYETLLAGGPEEEGEGSSLHITESLGIKPVIIEELTRELDFKKDLAAYRTIKKIIAEFKPDIVHTHASKAGAVGRLAAIHCKVPVIVHTFHGHVFHSYFGKLKTQFYKTVERYLAKRSDAIVAISEIQKKDLTEIFKICDAKKTRVINLGFDLARFNEGVEEKRKSFRTKFNIGDDELAIGIIGRLAPIKNHELFIDGIEHLTKTTKRKIKAVVIGDGETKEQLQNYLADKNLSYSWSADPSKLFVFTSWIHNVDWALAGLDLVCLTSKNEGTPVSLIEAQAAGKFIVCTNVGGTADILHKDCGLLSEISHPEDFISNLAFAVEHFDSLKEKAKNGQKAIMERFSYMRLVRDMEKLYEDLLKKRVS